ncbi:MAG: hypothetical protein E7643_04505 [Ruminococcaceae bacterium]|nr:hypothetical protein [Oscillospiraceae bacterium]
MRKNLRSMIEPLTEEVAGVLLDMNDYDLIDRAGAEPNTAHKKSAQMCAAWWAGRTARITFRTGGVDLSTRRYLTFSVYSTGMVGKSFRIVFDNSPTGEGACGYAATLTLLQDGWSNYRIELPFMRALRDAEGWDKIESIDFERVSDMGRAACLYIDSLYVWEGEAPPLYTIAPELKGAALFSTTGSFSIVDRRRIPNSLDGAPAKPFSADGTLWVPMATVAACMAHLTVADNRALSLSFTYRRKKYSFAANEKFMLEDGERITLAFAPRAVNGTLFFPVDFVREFFRWRQIFTDPMGLIVLSNRRAIFDGTRDMERIRALTADLTFLRPDADRILYDLHRRFTNPTRGRLFLSYEELMQLRRDAKTNHQLASYVRSLREQYGVGSAAFEDAPVSLDRLAGSEEENADVFRVASERLIAFALLYRVTGDKKYCERCAFEAEGLASLGDWNSSLMSTVGTVSLGMAIAYDWCHHMWSEARKAVVERAMLRNGMRVGLDCYLGKRKIWIPGGTAGAVVGAGMLALSLALCDIYPETAHRLLDRVLCNMEHSFAAYAPDGGYAEGVAACERSFRALCLSVAMLEKACGNDYGLFSAPGFMAGAYFQILSETGRGVWNYHNSAAVGADTSMLFWLSARAGDTTPAWMRRRQLLSGAKQVHPFDILFFTEVDDAVVPHLPLDAAYRRAGLAMMRSGWGEEDIFAGLHGGDNAVTNGDLDAGSILLDMGGVRFFAETGGVSALPISLRRRAEGQNTLVIDPAKAPTPDQVADAVAPFVAMRSGEDRAYAIVDMTATNPTIKSAKRGLMLTERRTVAVVQDEVTLTKAGTFVWTVYTPASVSVCMGGRALKLEKDGKTLLCKLGGVGGVKFEVTPMEGTELSRLRLCIEGKDRIRLSVACKLIGEGENASVKLYDTVPMSKW